MLFLLFFATPLFCILQTRFDSISTATKIALFLIIARYYLLVLKNFFSTNKSTSISALRFTTILIFFIAKLNAMKHHFFV